MKRFFSLKDQGSKRDQVQNRLITLASLVIITHAVILTLAPAVRYHAGVERYRYAHWLGVIVWVVAFAFLHQQSKHKLPNRDPFILPVVALLSGIGLLTIWRLYPNLGLRQTIWLALSTMVLFLGFQSPSYLNYLRRYKYIWLVLGLILTALTIFLGTNPNGSGPTLWLRFFGVHIQPSEPLKLILIAFLAGFFTDRLSVVHRKIEDLIPPLFVTGTALLLLIFQRDLGTASIFLLVYLAILFTAKGDKLILWITPLLTILIGVVGYLFIDIVRLRIDTWLNPFGDPSGASYQIIQSIIAIAEGGIIGAGPGLGSPSLIPVSVSDFIFSAIAEEFGFFGMSTTILLFAILLYRGIKIAISSSNSFHRYLSLGLVFYFGIQSILIIGGNIGLLPLTGVTLPFVSYGGSSFVVSFSALLILLTISQETPPLEKALPKHQPRFTLVSGTMIALLGVEMIATSLMSFWFMPSLVERPENPRWIVDDRFTERGQILDRDNDIIITNTGGIGSYQRTSNHIPLYPIIGYTNGTFGQTGIELSTYPYLRGYEGYPYFTLLWQDLVYNQPPPGLDVRLTIDLDLQRTADDLLGENSGAAIVMNANSGEILAMSSHPYFDAANLETEWENLVNDQDAPLVNRVTQGLYPPGGTLFPFIMATQTTFMQQNPEPEAIFPNQLKNPNCALPPGESLTWGTLMANGCTDLQVQLAQKTGAEALLVFYQTLGFYSEPELHLTTSASELPETLDYTDFYRGHASINISPLQMALAASALTNEGVLPGPRIVNAYQSPDGDWITLPKLTSNSQVGSLEGSSQITNLLEASNTPYWQVTSTSQAEDNGTITWFVAGTLVEWQGQPFTVVVVLEQGAPALAQKIGNSLIEQVIRFSGENP